MSKPKNNAGGAEVEPNLRDKIEVMWKAWHAVPFDNAAMTKAVQAVYYARVSHLSAPEFLDVLDSLGKWMKTKTLLGSEHK